MQRKRGSARSHIPPTLAVAPEKAFPPLKTQHPPRRFAAENIFHAAVLVEQRRAVRKQRRSLSLVFARDSTPVAPLRKRAIMSEMSDFAHRGCVSRTDALQTCAPVMLIDERHRAILRLLAENGRVTVAEIAERFGISAATARRDAVLLADAGKATRSHGGLLPSKFFHGEPHFRAKAVRRTEHKARLARKAAALLPHEGNVFIDAGTTCLEVGRLLLDRPDLHIFTNSIPLVHLGAESRALVIAIGGEVRTVSLALTGALAQAWLAHLRFDAAVIGASGLDLATGAYTTELHEGAVKAEALRRASLRMLVADATKWDQPTAVHFAPWNAFDLLVTTTEVARESRHQLARAKVKVVVA